jgi:uncharacterized protein (TIGR00730 family)
MKRICVFCGSNVGAKAIYAEAARRMAQELVRRRLGVVYGGGGIGLMGVLADAVLAAGGEVHGVIPHALFAREIGHHGLTELHVVDSMHERKQLMADLSDGFIALPGGFGTFEEFFEMTTWTQLGVHRKPCGLLDVDGFYAPLVAFLDHAAGEGFIRAEHRAAVVVDDDPARLIDRLAALRLPDVPKWITEQEA